MDIKTINNPNFWQKNYPEGVSYEIEMEKITLPAVLKRTYLTVPERTAMVFLEQEIEYKILAEWVNRFANALTNLGVKKGDRVALMLPNMPQFIVANYALLQIGAVGSKGRNLKPIPDSYKFFFTNKIEGLMPVESLKFTHLRGRHSEKPTNKGISILL
jgi:hypothetical protein